MLAVVQPIIKMTALFFPFAVALFSAWAWGRRGAVIAVALAPVWGFLLPIGRTFFPGGTHYGFDGFIRLGGAFTVAWLMGCIPGLVIGLAIRSIMKRRQISN